MDKITHNYTFRLRKSCRMVAYNEYMRVARAGSVYLEPGRVRRAFGLVQSGKVWQRLHWYRTTWDTCWCKDRRPKRYTERVTWCKHIIAKRMERDAAKLEAERASAGQRGYADVRVILDSNLAHKLDQDDLN